LEKFGFQILEVGEIINGNTGSNKKNEKFLLLSFGIFYKPGEDEKNFLNVHSFC
jgi:hypothetical protein